MKRKRVINLSIWAAIATVLDIAVVTEWAKNCVEPFGLFAAIGIYTGFCLVFALIIDVCIKEWHEYYGDDDENQG